MALITTTPFKSPTASYGSYFRILRGNLVCAPNTPTPRVELYIGQYESRAARDTNTAPQYQDMVSIPLSDLTLDPALDLVGNMYQAWKKSGFFDGYVVTDDLSDMPNASLDAVKAAKVDEINQARLIANTGTFTYQSKQFSCDTLSRSDIDGMNGFIGLNGTLPPNWVGQWKAVDNTFVPIATLDDWKAFYGAMVTQGQTNFVHAQSLKQMVANATTVEDVQAINWATATS